MRRLIHCFLFCLLFASFNAEIARSQSTFSVKAGTFNPEDAKAGFIVGMTTGRQVDERLDFSLGADLFIRKFSQKSAIDTTDYTGLIDPNDTQTEIEYSIYGLPIMVHFTIRVLPTAVVKPYIELAGGYELVFSREVNYLTDDKSSRFYSGFGWQVMLGGELPLGSSSAILGEILYNNATVKRSKGKTEQGLPIHEELDFSGLGFRVGLRF